MVGRLHFPSAALLLFFFLFLCSLSPSSLFCLFRQGGQVHGTCRWVLVSRRGDTPSCGVLGGVGKRGSGRGSPDSLARARHIDWCDWIGDAFDWAAAAATALLHTNNVQDTQYLAPDLFSPAILSGPRLAVGPAQGEHSLSSPAATTTTTTATTTTTTASRTRTRHRITRSPARPQWASIACGVVIRSRPRPTQGAVSRPDQPRRGQARPATTTRDKLSPCLP